LVATLLGIVSGETKDQAQGSSAEQASFDLDEYQYSVLEQSIESNYAVFYIDVTLSDTCVLKAARAYMVFDLLERSGEIVKSSPSVQDIEQEKFDKQFSVYFISNVSEVE